MLYIDVKYLSLASSALPLFTKKKEYLWDFRCPYCQDSQKKQSKKRGYIYRKDNDLYFKCHNCFKGTTFSRFIKHLDENLYKQYVLEKFMAQPENKHKNYKKPILESSRTAEKFAAIKKEYEKIPLESISELPNKHWVKDWVLNRKLPAESHKLLYFAPDFKKFICDNYGQELGKTLVDKEPRLVIPFFNSNRELTHIQGRSLLTNDLRYLTVKLKNEDKIFGLDRLIRTNRIHIVEGPLDSLFLKNCLAVGGGELSKISSMFPEAVFIFDNEPWNEEIIKNMKKVITEGRSIVIWPEDLHLKDINDMVLKNLDVDSLIENNTYRGLEAFAKFSRWSR